MEVFNLETLLFAITTITAIIAVIVSIKTLRSSNKMLEINNKMLESNTRPYINIYSNKILGDTSFFYIVIKNFGSTGAYIEDFNIDEKTKEIMDVIPNKSYHESLVNSRLEPGQSVTHLVFYEDIDDKNHISTFKIKYSSDTHTYEEIVEFNILSNVQQPTLGKSNKSFEHQILMLYQDEMRRSL